MTCFSSFTHWNYQQFIAALRTFIFCQSGLKIEFCKNIWIWAPSFWRLMAVRNKHYFSGLFSILTVFQWPRTQTSMYFCCSDSDSRKDFRLWPPPLCIQFSFDNSLFIITQLCKGYRLYQIAPEAHPTIIHWYILWPPLWGRRPKSIFIGVTLQKLRLWKFYCKQ